MQYSARGPSYDIFAFCSLPFCENYRAVVLDASICLSNTYDEITVSEFRSFQI